MRISHIAFLSDPSYIKECCEPGADFLFRQCYTSSCCTVSFFSGRIVFDHLVSVTPCYLSCDENTSDLFWPLVEITSIAFYFSDTTLWCCFEPRADLKFCRSHFSPVILAWVSFFTRSRLYDSRTPAAYLLLLTNNVNEVQTSEVDFRLHRFIAQICNEDTFFKFLRLISVVWSGRRYLGGRRDLLPNEERPTLPLVIVLCSSHCSPGSSSNRQTLFFKNNKKVAVLMPFPDRVPLFSFLSFAFITVHIR